MGAHPSGDGVSWSDAEAVDVDQPHGLDYRYVQHVAKGVRKRVMKEHVEFDDATVGGEHVPGGCQVLLRDTTTHFANAGDGTCIANGIACVTAGTQAGLWYFDDNTVATYLTFPPASICKGGDFTWTGHQQFDASVDATIVHVDASLTVTGAALLDGTTNIHGELDASNTTIDGTLTVLDRADFSAIAVAGDASFSGTAQCDATLAVTGQLTLTGAAAVFGTWASKDGTTAYQAETDGIVVAALQATNIASLQGYTDANSPPTTLRARGQNTYVYSGPNTVYTGLTMPVKKGDYYEVDASGSTSPVMTVYWLPLGA